MLTSNNPLCANILVHCSYTIFIKFRFHVSTNLIIFHWVFMNITWSKKSHIISQIQLVNSTCVSLYNFQTRNLVIRFQYKSCETKKDDNYVTVNHICCGQLAEQNQARGLWTWTCWPHKNWIRLEPKGFL